MKPGTLTSQSRPPLNPGTDVRQKTPTTARGSLCIYEVTMSPMLNFGATVGGWAAASDIESNEPLRGYETPLMATALFVIRESSHNPTWPSSTICLAVKMGYTGRLWPRSPRKPSATSSPKWAAKAASTAPKPSLPNAAPKSPVPADRPVPPNSKLRPRSTRPHPPVAPPAQTS